MKPVQWILQRIPFIIKKSFASSLCDKEPKMLILEFCEQNIISFR